MPRVLTRAVKVYSKTKSQNLKAITLLGFDFLIFTYP